MSSILKRASVTATSLRGRVRVSTWSASGGKTGNGNFIIAVFKRGDRSMGRRAWKGRDMQTRSVDLVMRRHRRPT
jgi:hypothetical protein